MASPSAVNIGQYPLFRVKEDNPLTICLSYHSSNARDVCDDGIGRGDFARGNMTAFTEKEDLVPVRLVHEDQAVGADDFLDPGQISSHVFRSVPDRVAGVQAFIRRIAQSTMPCKDAMNKASIQRKSWIPKVYGLLFSDPLKIRSAFTHLDLDFS